MDDSFAVRTRVTEDGVTVVSLTGQVDALSAPLVVAECQALADGGFTEVVVEATGVEFIDAAGVRSLLTGRELIHREGSHFYVVPSGAFERILGLLPLPSPFQTFGTTEKALDALRSARKREGG